MLFCKKLSKLLKFLKIIKSPKIVEKFDKKIEKIEKIKRNINIPIKSYIIELKMQESEVEEVLNKTSVKNRLYCTHCGYLFPKPETPVNYIITCEKCNRPLELPKEYYTT